MVLTQIVSGGQTGADQGALEAARQLGILSGGVAPKGWLTESGPEEMLLRDFGLVECVEAGYAARTKANVLGSDGTLIVGPEDTGGAALTIQMANNCGKPLFHVPCDSTHDRVAEFRDWLTQVEIRILNVAGKRESQSPGLQEFTRDFLIAALGGCVITER